MKKKLGKGLYVMTLATALVLGNICERNVFAAEHNKQEMFQAMDSATTVNGVADFGKGNASVCIYGNEGQTLKGKKFYVYQLFDCRFQWSHWF